MVDIPSSYEIPRHYLRSDDGRYFSFTDATMTMWVWADDIEQACMFSYRSREVFNTYIRPTSAELQRADWFYLIEVVDEHDYDYDKITW